MLHLLGAVVLRAYVARRDHRMPEMTGTELLCELRMICPDSRRVLLTAYADTEAATDFMLKQGCIDRSRLVATGGSYGGYMVAYMNGHTDRYRTYVCHAGCYDWVSMMATDGYLFFAKELGAFHWDRPAQVMKQSPHHYAKRFKTPTLVMHGDDDQIVPYADSAPLSAKLLKNGTLKTYKGFPHGMPTTEAATINADLLAFIKG